MRRTVPWVVLVLMLGGSVVSGLASPGVGRASESTGRSDTAAVVASRQRLAELDVSAAAVKLLAENVLAGSATVGNVGSARARSSTADVAWKSSDSGGLVQLGRFTVPALKPGQRHKAHFQFDLPRGASGKYEVSVCADVLGQVHSKKNDCRDAGVITILGSGVKASGPTSSEPSSPSGSSTGGSSPAPGSPTPTPPASSPPDTVIDSGPSGAIGQSSVTFTFHGSDTNDTFQCSLDGAPWALCTSPQQYSSLAEGAHTFQVRAVNAAGEVDLTPASAFFTVEATPPQTTITGAPSGRVPIGEVSISFTSTQASSTFQCSLDGASYSLCSSPDVVKDPAAGPHTFNVQATNQAGVKEIAAPPSASWSSVEPQHDLCGTISSNTTIGPDYAARYIITCTVTVASSATLTAQPGTIIKFDNATKLSVDGTLNAVGTASEPITFTSINDNSVGGATGNGSPAVSEWSGIEVLGAQSSVDMQHVSIGYSDNGLRVEGSEAPVIFSDDAVGNVALRGVEVAKAKAGATFSDDVIEDAGYEGIEVGESGATSVTDSTVSAAGYAIEEEHPAGPVTVTGNSVAQVTNATYGAERGIAVRENQAGEAVKIADNALVVLAGAAIEVDSPSLDFAELATNTISGPESTRLVLVEGTVAASQTLGPEPFAWGIGIQQGPLEVPAGVTLTIVPGALVKAGHGRSGCGEPGGCVDLYGAESKLVVHGSLNAIGTTEKPITFTSINDNSVGGETGDGTPEPGEWAGIEVLGAQSYVDMQHVSVSYAGDGLHVEGSEAPVTFDHDVVRNAALRGVEVAKAKAGATFSSDVIENVEYAGIVVMESGAMSVTGSTVSAGGFEIEADAPAGPVTITDNSLAQVANPTYTYHVGGRGVEVRENRTGEAVAVAHNTLAMLAGAAIEVDSPSLDFAELATNTISGQGSTRMVLVEGAVAASQTLGSEPFAWGIGIQQGPLEVPAGVTLTVAPGTVVKAGHEQTCEELRPCVDLYGAESKLVVHGALDAVGTASEPITFTSINDNSVGGATGDGSPEADEWPGIEVLGAQSSADLQHVTVGYGSDGLYLSQSSAGATVRDSVVDNVQDYGIDASDSGALSVTGTTVSAEIEPVTVGSPTGAVTVTEDALTQIGGWPYGGVGVAVHSNSSSAPVSVAHNTVAMLKGAGVEVQSRDLSFAELATNTITGPESTRVVLVEGAVAASQTLGPEPFAWGIGIQQGPLEVPAGVTLTVAPGTVIKAGHELSCELRGCFDAYGAESKLVVKGSLDAVGTADKPIAFTSINDNSVGGATGDGSPEANEWPGIEETDASAVIDLADVSVRYAGAALNVTAGTAAIRGSFDAEHDLNGLQACIWGGGCSVDAAYTYWGSPSGPGSSDGTDAACGAVTTTPYLTSATGEETATESSVFAPGDCGSGTTPPQELTTAEASTAITVDGLESLCREDHEEAACEVVRQYEKCMSAATTLAQQNAPYNFSDDAQDAASAGASFIAKSEKAVVSGLAGVASFGLELIGVASTIHDIATAYNTCDP